MAKGTYRTLLLNAVGVSWWLKNGLRWGKVSNDEAAFSLPLHRHKIKWKSRLFSFPLIKKPYQFVLTTWYKSSNVEVILKFMVSWVSKFRASFRPKNEEQGTLKKDSCCKILVSYFVQTVRLEAISSWQNTATAQWVAPMMKETDCNKILWDRNARIKKPELTTFLYKHKLYLKLCLLLNQFQRHYVPKFWVIILRYKS